MRANPILLLKAFVRSFINMASDITTKLQIMSKSPVVSSFSWSVGPRLPWHPPVLARARQGSIRVVYRPAGAMVCSRIMEFLLGMALNYFFP